MGLIDIDNLNETFDGEVADICAEYRGYETEWGFSRQLIHDLIARSPIVEAVPINELRVLRDQLYEADRITMNGLGQLNALIAKYESSVL